jgi:hypothetical protein
VPVLFEFGFGLSYTSWRRKLTAFSAASSAEAAAAWASPVQVGVALTNTGALASSHVVVLFGVPPPAEPTSATADAPPTPRRPRRILLGFERVGLVAPGETIAPRLVIEPSRQFVGSDAQGAAEAWKGCWGLAVEEATTQICAR